MHMRTFFLSGYNNGDYDMWRVGREQTIEVRDHQTDHQTYPDLPLSHDPFLGKNIFSWVSTHEIYLEIVSGKSPESRPRIAKSGKSPEKSFRDIP